MSKPEELVIRFNRWKVIPPALMGVAFLTLSVLILNTIEPGMPWHWKTYAPKHPMTKFEYAVLVALFGACALGAAFFLLVFLNKFWRGVALSLGPEGMCDGTGALHKCIRWTDLEDAKSGQKKINHFFKLRFVEILFFPHSDRWRLYPRTHKVNCSLIDVEPEAIAQRVREMRDYYTAAAEPACLLRTSSPQST